MADSSTEKANEKVVAPREMARRQIWSTVLKSVVTFTLLGYLFHSGALDISAMGLLATEPTLASATAINWIVVSAVLGAWRYRTLLLALDIHISTIRSLYLQLVSLFLNTVVPGSIGGDVWKSLAVAKQHSERKRMLLLMLVVERGIGLSALMAASCLIWLPARIWGSSMPDTNGHLTVLFAVLATGLIGTPLVTAVALEWETGWKRLEPYASNRAWLKNLVAGAKILRGQRKHLVRAYVISMAMHSLSIGYFFLLCNVIPGATLDIGTVATVFPIGILSVLLPVSLAGLGVGHLAFEGLFVKVGASGGANVFNLYIFGQAGPNLLGAIPFVLARNTSRKNPP